MLMGRKYSELPGGKTSDGNFLLRRQIGTKSQHPSSLRIACNPFAAETVFVPLRFQAANRFSASATQASSTAVSGSSCISTSNRSANRSRSVAGSLRACFSRANARVVICTLRSKTTLGNGSCTRFHTNTQRHGRLLNPSKRSLANTVKIINGHARHQAASGSSPASLHGMRRRRCDSTPRLTGRHGATGGCAAGVRCGAIGFMVLDF
jgi:hypothetical protein